MPAVTTAKRPQAPWQAFRRAIGLRPIVAVEIAARPPMRVERFLFQARRQRLPGVPAPVLLVHLGGARVSGGRLRGQPGRYVPSFAVYLPANCVSEWTLDGAIDVAGVYLPAGFGQRGRRKGLASQEERGFSDRLVGALARQIVDEAARGRAADSRYLAQLGRLLLRQLERVLDGLAGERATPAGFQLGRLRSVLARIDRDLAADLSIAELAREAGVAPSHFRRLFAEATGTSPGRYVQARRLERARELLAETQMPVAHVAAECGLASQSHLTTRFRAQYGITPARFRLAVTDGRRSPSSRAARDRSRRRKR